MEKITITNLIDFRRKNSDRSKQTYANNLKFSKAKSKDQSGGDYWMSALTAISNKFKENDLSIIPNKIDELIDKIENNKGKNTKDMFQRNVNVLQNFEDFDFTYLKPDAKLTFLKKPKSISIINIENLPIFAKPHHVFTYTINEVKYIGAMWFIAKLNGFKYEEISVVTEILYRYLDINFADKYKVSEDYCTTVDVTDLSMVNYTQISKIKSTLIETLDELKSLMK